MLRALGDFFRMFLAMAVAAGLFEMAHSFDPPKMVEPAQAFFVLLITGGAYMIITKIWEEIK